MSSRERRPPLFEVVKPKALLLLLFMLSRELKSSSLWGEGREGRGGVRGGVRGGRGHI